MLADTWLHPSFSCCIDQILHVSIVTVHLVAFLHGKNLPLDRLVESYGTSRLELLQLGFSNLNSVFNIDIIPVTMLNILLHWETSRGSTHVSSLSLIAFLSSASVFIIEGDSSLWWSTSWSTSTTVGSLKSVMSFFSGKEHARSV